MSGDTVWNSSRTAGGNNSRTEFQESRAYRPSTSTRTPTSSGPDDRHTTDHCRRESVAAVVDPFGERPPDARHQHFRLPLEERRFQRLRGGVGTRLVEQHRPFDPVVEHFGHPRCLAVAGHPDEHVPGCGLDHVHDRVRVRLSGPVPLRVAGRAPILVGELRRIDRERRPIVRRERQPERPFDDRPSASAR